jgi:hypothetical protein
MQRDGVQDVLLSQNGAVFVTYDTRRTSLEKLRAVLEKSGYEVG